MADESTDAHATVGEDICSATGRRLTWWLAAAVVLIGSGVMAGLQFVEFPTAAERFLATASAGVLLVLLLLVWLLFFAGLRPRLRWSVLAAAVSGPAIFVLLVRVEGVSGDFVPKLTWRWTTKADEALTSKPADSTGRRTVDLSATSARDFPQFLGRDRRGVVEGVQLACDWQAQPPRRLWRQPIGAGWSAFAVVGNYAVTQEQRGDQEMVVCYELLTGKEVWRHADQERFSSVVAGDGPRATPTVHEGRVYTMGAQGLLNCLNGATGEWIWSRDVLEESGASNSQWGKSCSPAIIDNLVVVTGGEPSGPSLLAYNKQTGKPAWQAGNDAASYASPLLATLAGTRQIVIVNANSVAAYAPANGRFLWRHAWPGSGEQPKVPQPVPLAPDRVFITAGYGIGCAMLRITKEYSGRLIVEELELRDARTLKPKFSNVVVHDGFVYGLDDGRALVCLDLASGRRMWRGGRFGHGQVLLVGDLLLVQSESGEVALVEATSEEFHERTRFAAIDGKSWNNPVLSGPYLLVRNAREAACYKLPLAEAGSRVARQGMPWGPDAGRRRHGDTGRRGRGDGEYTPRVSASPSPRVSKAGAEPGTTTLANPRITFTRSPTPYAVLRRGEVEGVVVDNSAVDDDVVPQHRAGYSGLASLKHKARPENLFVPPYAGLNFEHIHDGTVQPREILFEPRLSCGPCTCHLNRLGRLSKPPPGIARH